MDINEARIECGIGECAAPETLEDVAMQLEMLSTAADEASAHIVADDLLITALRILATQSGTDITPLVTAYEGVPKWYE